MNTEHLIFAVVFEDYLKNRKLKKSTRHEYTYCLREQLADWIYLPIASISRNDVFEKHKQLKAHGPFQADLAFRLIRALYMFASEFYEDENGKPLIVDNPTKKLSGMKSWTPLKRRTGRIPREKAKLWWDTLAILEDSPRDFLKLIYLTGLRKMEAASLRWDGVDFDAGTLTIFNTKNGKDHILPMSTHIRELLEGRKALAGGTYVFPGHYADDHISGNDRTYVKVAIESGIRFTPHDLRRGFISTATELDVEMYPIKKLVNHASSDVTFGYYVADINKLRAIIQMIDDELMRCARGEIDELS